MQHAGGRKSDGPAADRQDIARAQTRRMQTQRAAMLRKPTRIQVNDDRHRPAVVVPKLVTMLPIAGPRRVEREVTFIFVETQKQFAIQR